MKKSEALLLLKKTVSLIYPLSDDDWEALSGIWIPCFGDRKEILTSPGHKEKHLYFVIKGVQRVYYNDEHNREATLVFTYAPSFGGVLDSFLLQKPSRYFYECLSASSFLRTSYSELNVLMEKRPSIATMINLGVTTTLSGVLERVVELQSFSSEEKFRCLLKRSPHILQLVPHKYLANYLGIEATNFSKLINRIKI